MNELTFQKNRIKKFNVKVMLNNNKKENKLYLV